MSENRKPPVSRVGRRSPRQALSTLSGILAEMGRIYRQAKAKTLDHEEARSLVWMLSQMRAAAESQELERLHGRLDEMDASLIVGSSNGHITRTVSPTLIEDRRS